ncbi:hypothetical protein ACI2OW_19100 [Pseudomonas shirazica]|uniref:hypothetical protein n=1 Tax=Pseudomonas TaxID=286 RepID=UPI0038528B54
MILANGNSDVLKAKLGTPLQKNQNDAKEKANTTEQDLIRSVYDEICNDLDKISQTVQSELLSGITEVVESIEASYDLGVGETDTLASFASSIRLLAQQITSLFEIQPYLLQRQYAAYESNVGQIDETADDTLRTTVDDFMKAVKPPEPKPTLRDRLLPYIPELKRLREAGYTYAQFAQSLEKNGIKTYVGAISGIMNELR